MDEKEDFNLTLPIILLGLIAVGALLFFTLFDKNGPESLKNVLEEAPGNQVTAAAYHFTAPDRVSEGDTALFSWNVDASEQAVCEGSSVPEGGSDGGWTGVKDASGTQEVGPIDKNTTYFLDCLDGEEVSRDMELVSVLEPQISLSANSEVVTSDGSVSVAWDAVYVVGCELTNGSGEVLSREINGVYNGMPMDESDTFTLTCETNTEPLVESITINLQ